jgi:endoglucanase
VRVPGTGDGPSLALVGHIDEIAVVVTNLGDDGFAAVRPTSGWDPAVMAGQRVEVLTRAGAVPGVVAARRSKRKRGEDRKPIEGDDLFLDVGARDGDELRSIIRPGDNVIWQGAPMALHGNRVASRAFDNRMGCYVALESARRIAEGGGGTGDVIAVAAVQEEVGDFAGSRTAAFGLDPDLALAIDVTHTSDVPGADPNDEGKILMGGGPTISRGPSIHEDVFELLHDTAEAEGIPFTVEVSRAQTSTDADAVYLSRAGVATGLVSVPLRYMHSPIETLDLDDLENAVRLVVAFARRLEPGMSFTG